MCQGWSPLQSSRPALANWLSLGAVVFEWRGGALSEARPEERQEKGRIAGRKNQLHSSRPGLGVTTARIFPRVPKGNFGHIRVWLF